MRFERFPIFVMLVLALSLVTVPAFGQSLSSGSISGTVVDPSRAVVANATVNLKSLDTGSAATTTTNATGAFSFGLLKPGNYQITVTTSGFSDFTETMQVAVGETTNASVNLSVSKGKVETIEVTESAPLINTDPSINTTFTQAEVAQLPSAGGDITNIADTAPGVVVNGTGGYGNFTANGMPATSNLFTVNGENDMDPYFNINNSGASNLTLGQNEVGEATVITNAYGGQYGQLAGAQVTYVTKSGTNTFHGNAEYWWNGRLLNANNWMSKEGAIANGQPNIPAFSNANQWATSFGGPIVKNKTFFFVDYEGMRFLLPNVDQVTAPSAAFANAAMANVATLHPGETTDYDKLMNLYLNAPNYSGGAANAPLCFDVNNNSVPCGTAAVVSTDSCYALGQSGFFGAGWSPTAPTACSQTYITVPKALAKEFIFAAKVDQKITNNDNMFFRYKLDHGVQPTSLDPINAAFDANSNQPAWDTQFQETHLFGQTKTNQFTASLSHYVALFSAPTAAATFNYAETFNEDQGIYDFTSPNNGAPSFPQGRNITQYQFIDDFSWTKGNHTLKFGENFRRYDISDHNFFYTSPRVYWGYTTNALQSFANGEAYQYRKADNIASNVPIALWGIGVYGQDEWKATRNLKLTLAMRVERNSNPVCQVNCFANFPGSFANTASAQAGSGGSPLCGPAVPACNVPYSSDIKYNQHSAYPSVDKLLFSPRFGFSWDPRGNGKTVISGGFGLFYDNPAAGLVDNLLANPPDAVALRIRNSPSSAGVLPFDPAGAPATYTASVAAFNITKSFEQIQATLPAGVAFNAPAFGALVGETKSPEWDEYNISLQQELNRSTVLIINYVGNHGSRISYSDNWPNAWDQTPYLGAANPGSFFTNIPITPAAPNYATVTEFRQGAVSNYNGLTFSLRKQFSKWISAHVNYTWSHNIDETSNGGLFQYGFEGNNTILGQISPYNLRLSNYGNSDYDVRHLVNGDFVFNPEFHKTGAMSWLVNGWQFSGKAFWRTGLPYTITDGNIAGLVVNSGEVSPATITGNAQPGSCGKSNASYNNQGVPGCLSSAGVFDTGTALNNWFSTPGAPALANYPAQHRNQYRGPHYFDMDLNLFKNFKIAERFNFAIGAQAFNAFNHPNFGLPNANYLTGDNTFGTISAMQGTPTSPYGNFLGFDSSPRVMQLSAKIVF